jgi:hypothetical protein
MRKRESTIEWVVTVVTIVALAVLACFGSAYGGRGLSEIYGETSRLGLETRIAITAHRWSPYFFGILLLGYVWLRRGGEQRRWPSWCALSLASLTTGMVFYGIVLPFASTNFQMR